MNKIKINMLSSADKVDGQGVGSAYIEQVALIKEGAKDFFEVSVNDKNYKKYDILHVHTIDPKNFIKIKRFKGITVCYVHFLPDTLDGSISLPKPIFWLFKHYVVNLYKAADYLVVVNPIFIDALVECGLDKNRIIYIPNYVSKQQFYSISFEEKNEIRKRYDIAPDKFVVLGVGQVQTRKGVLDFVEVAKQMPDILFIWCGGFSFGKITDGYDELKKIVENPPHNVRFLGIIPRTEMNNIYNIANVLFMPSYNELFPMAILEAVNSHLPILLRDLELYKDILFMNYHKGTTNKDFVKELNKLYSDETIYLKGKEMSKNISNYYTKENVLSLWIKFYTEIFQKCHSKK